MLSRRSRAFRLTVCSLLLTCALLAQIADAPAEVVADIPVNYTEAKVGTYVLPDPLKLNNRRTVKDAKTWVRRRRPEILGLIEENWFGRSPGRPKDMRFEVVEQGTPAFDGKAIRKQITIHFTKHRTGPKMELLVYVPANAKGPVPLLLNMSFTANNLTVADPDVKVGMRWDRQTRTQVAATPMAPPAGGAAAGRRARSFPVEQFLPKE
jgi:hypothetical protein